MTNLSSATPVAPPNENYYASASPDQTGSQLPAGRFVFRRQEGRVMGWPILGVNQAFSSYSNIVLPAFGPALQQELDLWQEASREALSSFESSLGMDE